ncbi:MAG: hypothetical protein M3Y28_00045 [Armatimonadota bacterium]|nr:hypothetical protein [Armatimonadota bacterium]
MATKTTEKKSTSKKTAAADPMPALADEVLVTLLHRALVRLGEPTRVTEIVRELDEESVTVGLARHVLENNSRRFVAVDRRWDLAQRYFDKQRPVARTLEELVALYGTTMPTAEAPGELAQIYGRVKEHFAEVAPRLLRGPRFFPVRRGRAFGLRSWLLNTESTVEADLLFYNYLQPEMLTPLAKIKGNLDWAGDPVGAAQKVLEASGGQTVDNRLIQYLAFKALGEDDFDAVGLYETLGTSDAFLGLSDHRWLPTATLDAIRAQWRAKAEQVGEGAAEEPVAEAVVAVETAAQPLEVTADDLAELRRFFEDREDIATAAQLLTDVLEVRAGSRTFAEDTQTLTAYLRSKPEDFLWVGAERFRAPGTLPPYIGQLPESLRFPTLPRFETADGEILDQMLDDEAFEDGLAEEILDPVAQDVNDQEPNGVTRWPEGVGPDATRLPLVLKSHHKEIGTFPLAQVPFGFFPTEPNIVELTLRDAAGNGYPIYVDYDVQLVYGLFDVYGEIAADSGAAFHLEKTDKPDEYKFVLDNETDPSVFVSPARMDELIEYRSEVESGPAISTYDIMRHILDHYRKGCSFLTLLTEVNLVRRTPRRLIASILSGYTAFHPRANRWTFDAKKEPEGFDRKKTPFIKH